MIPIPTRRHFLQGAGAFAGAMTLPLGGVIAQAAAELPTIPIPPPIGEAERLQRLAKARSLKPSYWPAYLNWAEYLRRTGEKAKAREMVEEGLSYSPDAKALRRLLTDLGGDPRTIAPRPSEEPTTTPGK